MLRDGTKYEAIVGDRAVEIILDGRGTGSEPVRVIIDGKASFCSVGRGPAGTWHLLLDGRSHPLTVEDRSGGRRTVTQRGIRTDVVVRSERDLLLERFGPSARSQTSASEIRAPMPGRVLRIRVEEGQTVNTGDRIIVLEAMKMENELHAGSPGVISVVHVIEGDAVEKDQLLAEIRLPADG
jgi:biotin carboxyl carrier protein